MREYHTRTQKKATFAGANESRPPAWYDLETDWPLIVASFAEQYGIRLEREDIAWPEYKKLFSGLSGDTPLGRIINIRSEKDKNVMKSWNADQKRIRREWLGRRQSAPEAMNQIAQLERAVAQAFGRGE